LFATQEIPPEFYETRSFIIVFTGDFALSRKFQLALSKLRHSQVSFNIHFRLCLDLPSALSFKRLQIRMFLAFFLCATSRELGEGYFE